MQILVKIKIPWLKVEENERKTFAQGTSVADILREYGIEEKNESNFLIVVNGKVENKAYLLEEGDKLSILPALIGG